MILQRLLLELGAKPDIRDEKGQYLLLKAHANGQHEIVRLMLESQANPLALSGVTLREACQYGYAEYALQVYRKQAADALTDFSDLVVCLKMASKFDFVETALGIIIAIKDETRKMDCFGKWRESQAPLDKAHTTEKTTTTISSQENNSLLQCCNINNTKKMIELLKEGHDPNIKNDYGKPLLHLCKTRGAVHALCECSKLDITQKDNLGRNVLFYTLDWCVGANKTCLYDYLKAKGAEVVPDKFGRTILHEWKETNDGLSLEKLLEDFPDINVCDHKNRLLYTWLFSRKTFPKCVNFLNEVVIQTLRI